MWCIRIMCKKIWQVNGIANKTDKYRWYRDLDVETRFYFFIVNARSRGATIPVTWANVTSDTGRFFDSRLSNMRRAAIRRAGASRPYNHGGIETDTLLLNCKKISSIRALSIARGPKADLTNQTFFIFLIFKWYSLLFQMSPPFPDI